jgi:hypothetical protein
LFLYFVEEEDGAESDAEDNAIRFYKSCMKKEDLTANEMNWSSIRKMLLDSGGWSISQLNNSTNETVGNEMDFKTQLSILNNYYGAGVLFKWTVEKDPTASFNYIITVSLHFFVCSFLGKKLTRLFE